MTEHESKSLTGLLKGLMPRITDDQGAELCWKIFPQFRRLEYVACENAVRDYTYSRNDFSMADFRSFLKGYADEGPLIRTARYIQRQHEEGRKALEEKERVNREYESIVLGMSEEAIAKLAKDAVDGSGSEDFRQWVLKHGPANSYVLRTYIVQFMEGQGRGLANAHARSVNGRRD